MAFAAGETLTAAKLNRIQPVTYPALASSTLTLSTSNQDVAGATVTFNTVAANAKYRVTGDFDCFAQTHSSGVTVVAGIAVDGADHAETANFQATATGGRAGISRMWEGTLASAGSHTIKLRARKDVNAGTYQVVGTSSKISVEIIEVV